MLSVCCRFVRLFIVQSTVLSIVLWCGQVLAEQAQVAEVSVEPTRLVLTPLVPCGGLTLSVQGPGELRFQKRFDAGERVVFSALDENGATRPDGVYRYEVRLIPIIDEAIRSRYEDARDAGLSHEIARMRREGLLPTQAHTQGGIFKVIDGSIAVVVPETREDMSKDILQLDDVIIDGSVCVGVDCYNGIDFGDDVVRLQENNLRLSFIDTSDDLGTFPKNDWELVANDSIDGGQERFSIVDLSAGTTPFTLLAGAADSSIFVDGDGDLGLGTSTPGADVHLIRGDTPSARFEQDASLGLALQTWDLEFNDAAFSLRNVTAGGAVPFQVASGAPDGAFRLTSDGYLSLGTVAPRAQLEIFHPSFATAELWSPGGASFRLAKTSSFLWDLFLEGASGRLYVTDDPDRARIPIQLFRDVDDGLIRVGYPTSETIRIWGTAEIYGGLVVSPGSNISISESGEITAWDRYRLARSTGGAVWSMYNDDLNRLGFSPTSTLDRTPLRILPGASDLLLELGQFTSDTVLVTGRLVVDDGALVVDHSNIKITDAGEVTIYDRLSLSGQGSWHAEVDGTTGVLRIGDDSTWTRVPMTLARNGANDLIRVAVTASDTVDITGRLVINGTDVTPDYVFDTGYNLESIEEHTAAMWRQKHLPALAPAEVDENGRHLIDVGARSQAVVEELEKAHIYIGQLHERLVDSENEVQELRETVEILLERIEKIEVGSER